MSFDSPITNETLKIIFVCLLFPGNGNEMRLYLLPKVLVSFLMKEDAPSIMSAPPLIIPLTSPKLKPCCVDESEIQYLM